MAATRSILESVREDDFVEYFLFPKISNLDKREEESMINSVLREANVITKKFSKQYLWHKDPFALTARTSVSNLLCNEEGRENLPAHLYGISHYGENIEDEWFIVYLLFSLTKEIDGLIARVADADGEFLLIEAAESLPQWAKPENCEKRVYIYKGMIHIVAPLENNVNDASEIQNVSEALKEISQNPSLTVASNEIQQAIRNKISAYPARIQENLHRTKAYVPISIASILQHKPSLISAATQAFCNRDTVDSRVCRAMKYFPPENRVYTSITFSKCLYAMIMHSKYVPERKIGWNLPQPTSPQYKAHLLGVKIACGFEILISQAKPSADIEGDKGWHAYLKSLRQREYFRDLLEHSKEYDELLKKAKEHYVEQRDSMQYSPAIGQEILELYRNLDVGKAQDEFENDLQADDDDSWLNISPEDLDKMLVERYGHKKVTKLSAESDASNFTEKITSFLEHISDVDGAEFPEPELGPVKPPRTKNDLKSPKSIDNSLKSNDNYSTKSKIDPKTSNKLKNNINNTRTKENGPKTDANVNFDANSFNCAVQNILNFVIPEDDAFNSESDSELDEYDREEEPAMEYGDLKTKMEEYMQQMDQELALTTIGKSFKEEKTPVVQDESSDQFDDIEDFKPVDIDMNALKNILESYKSQMGEAGPSSTMLGPMGFHLKHDEVDDSD